MKTKLICSKCSGRFYTYSKLPDRVKYCDFCREEIQRQRVNNNNKINRERKKANNIKQPLVKTCLWCSKEFTAVNSSQKYCNKHCAYLFTKANSASSVKTAKPNKKIKEIATLGQSIKIVEQYNKQHGTAYTYGQAVARGII